MPVSEQTGMNSMLPALAWIGLGVQLLFGTFMQITLYQGIVLPLLMSKA